MTKIKICGCKRLQDIELVNKYLPDYIGFVFANSKRKIEDAVAMELKAALSNQIKAVGVFVNEPIEHIVDLCKKQVIDVVQLHGDETKEYITKLKGLVEQPIIKAIRVQSSEQVQLAESLPCEYLLLDTYIKDAYGGSGVSFDWSMIPHLSKPYFLAGGLNSENIKRAIHECRPYCVDISSGVELDGYKDEGKIREIMRQINCE